MVGTTWKDKKIFFGLKNHYRFVNLGKRFDDFMTLLN